MVGRVEEVGGHVGENTFLLPSVISVGASSGPVTNNKRLNN